MRTTGILLVLLLLLTGCGVYTDYETVNDDYFPLDTPEPREIELSVPEDAAVLTGISESEKLYCADGYEILLETYKAGDLNETFRRVTGYQRDKLTVMEIPGEGINRYCTAWISAGEAGDVVSRCMILDDGNYHYCLSITLPSDAGSDLRQLADSVFASYGLVSY